MVVYWRVQYIIIKYSWTMPSLNARIAKAMPLDSQQHVSDIARYRCKKPGTLVSIIPFFLSNGLDHFFWSLRLWSSGATCVRVATALYALFSTKCRNNSVLLRVGLQCSFDLTIFFSLRVKKILLQKTIITAFSHNDQTTLCFWLSRYIQCIYIWSTKCPSVHEFNK